MQSAIAGAIASLIVLVPAALAAWQYEGGTGYPGRAYTEGANGTVLEATCGEKGTAGYHISPAPVTIAQENAGKALPAELKVDGEAVDAGLTCFNAACAVTHAAESAAALTRALRSGGTLTVEIEGEQVETYSLSGSASAIFKLKEPGGCPRL